MGRPAVLEEAPLSLACFQLYISMLVMGMDCYALSLACFQLLPGTFLYLLQMDS